MKQGKNFFPLGLALGNAFCNRVKEKKRLTENISKLAPTLISSPRRYGKTSLVLETLQSTNTDYVLIDFFTATSVADISSIILNGIGRAIALIQPNFTKALKLAMEFFSKIEVKISTQETGFVISLNQGIPNPVDEIDKALINLEKLLIKYNKNIILFFDEFQIVGQVTPNISIEAILRSHAQIPSNIGYIFSGSNRHLLDQIFNDRKRPFYQLCDRILLNKIETSDYMKFINNAAIMKWQSKLGVQIFNKIFELTNCHPFYMNALCFKLWQTETTPNVDDVIQCWSLLAEEHRPQIGSEIDLLSLNQRKLLGCLARLDNLYSIHSKEFLQSTGMASSSLHQSLQVMLKKDFIEKINDETYQIIDPMLEFLLKVQ
jgi:hypothetical protein